MFLRIFTAVALISVLAVAVSTFHTVRAVRHASYRSLTDGLDRMALAVRALVPGLTGDVLQDAVTRMGREAGVRITVIDAEGKVTADSDGEPGAMESHGTRPEVALAMEGKTGIATRRSGTTGTDTVYVAVPVLSDGKPAGAVRAAYGAAVLGETDSALAGGIALFAGILLAACLLSAAILSRALTVPLQELTATVRRFTEGDFDARFHLRQGGEPGELADSFNSMADRIQVQFREITERTEELDGIFTSVPQGIVVLDAKGRIKRMNGGFREIVGSGPMEGRELWDVTGAPRLADLVEKVKREGLQPPEEIVIGSRTARCSINPLPGGEGLIAVLHDITDTRRIETMKRDFVANASHELRTPLTAIRGYLEMIEGEVSGEPSRWLATVRRSSERMVAIVEDLLSLARLEGKETELITEPVDVARLLDDAKALFMPKAEAKGLRLVMTAPPEPPTLMADPFLLDQMMANLIDNALKYTEAGEVRVACRPDGERVAFDFSDTGIGIPTDHLSRVFERFYVVDKSRSRKMGGTGLGLSIVKHIVDLHGGSISVDSVVGQGTRFTVLLPRGRETLT